jgi:carboxymethylenebutenolidase
MQRKIGAVGFCFGEDGLDAGLARELDAVCTFYGGGMQQLFDCLAQIRCPVLGLFGDQDESIPLGTIEEFDRVLDVAGVPHEIVVYPASGHAFFRDRDPTVFRPAAARDAWQRMLPFFEGRLGLANGS